MAIWEESIREAVWSSCSQYLREKEWKVNLTSWIVYFSLVIIVERVNWPCDPWKPFAKDLSRAEICNGPDSANHTASFWSHTGVFATLTWPGNKAANHSNTICLQLCAPQYAFSNKVRLSAYQLNQNYNITRELPQTIITKCFTTDKQ